MLKRLDNCRSYQLLDLLESLLIMSKQETILNILNGKKKNSCRFIQLKIIIVYYKFYTTRHLDITSNQRKAFAVSNLRQLCE